MHRLNGAQIIIALLERQGIETIAGIPGGANLPLYDALYQSRKIRHILARHEQGAGFIAQGMARASGKPAVCFATSGPGATNILTAIADAYMDSIPVICITGQVPSGLIGTDAFQEVDIYGMSIPITKHNFLVRSASELLEVIPRAFHLATSGRPGPVLIDVPKDIQLEKITIEAWPDAHQPGIMEQCSRNALNDAALMINQAQRPLLYLGGGVIHAGGGAAARLLAEQASIPAVMTLMGLGVLPSTHPLSLGMLGMHANRATNLIMEECDLLIAAGVRFDDRATGKIQEFCPTAKVIHLDIDPSEVSKLKTAHLGLIGDVNDSLNAMLPLIDTRTRRDWNSRIAQLQAQNPDLLSSEKDMATPYGLIEKVGQLAPDNTLITTDVGKHQMWVAQAYPFQSPRQFLTSGGLGTMGFGLPAAIGAAIACPDRLVICFSGDGSLQMNIQELATASEQNVNIKIIVLNNNSLGLVRQQQKLFYEQHHFASEYQLAVNFPQIARGFGIPAHDLDRVANSPEALLKTCFETPGPCLIHVPIDIEEDVYPMVPPGAANTTMIGGEYAQSR